MSASGSSFCWRATNSSSGCFVSGPERLALTSWLVTAVIAIAVTGALAAAGFVQAFVPIAIGLTTTALGTLLPDLARQPDARGPLREIHHGRRSGRGIPSYPGRGSLPQRPGRIPRVYSPSSSSEELRCCSPSSHGWPAHEKIQGILSAGEHETSQTSLRWTMVLLFALLVIAADFGLDVVLGAFLAGVVLRRWAPGDVHALEAKLDAVGYGFFIPVFFVTSGMSLDLQSIIESPARMIVFFVLFLLVRGLFALLFYRRELHAWSSANDAAHLDRLAAARCTGRNRPRVADNAARERRGAGWARVCSRSSCSPRSPLASPERPPRPQWSRPRQATTSDRTSRSWHA